MIQNFNIRKKGFPDLFGYNDEKSFFCEVKGNTDILSNIQVKKHEILLNSGIDVVILSINKNKAWQIEQKKNYFNKSYIRSSNFIDIYNSISLNHANIAFFLDFANHLALHLATTPP